MTKFRGTYSELQDRVTLIGIRGQWRDLGNQKQYRANTGALLNFYVSTGTVNVQGKEPAKTALKVAYLRVAKKGKKLRPHNGSRAKNGKETELNGWLAEKLKSKATNVISGRPVTREWAQNTCKRIGLALTCCGELSGWEMSFLDSMERKLSKASAAVTDKQM